MKLVTANQNEITFLGQAGGPFGQLEAYLAIDLFFFFFFFF